MKKFHRKTLIKTIENKPSKNIGSLYCAKQVFDKT